MSETARDRDELIIQAIVTGDTSVLGEPRDRLEAFLIAIAETLGSKANKSEEIKQEDR